MTSRAVCGLAAFGAAATTLVVAASALLRITADFDAAGTAHSMLPATMETAVRMIHRVGATAAGLAALAVAIAVALQGRARSGVILTGAILVLTTFLALLGRHSAQAPGAAIPVANAMGGTLLACAFAALSVRSCRARTRVEGPAGMAVPVVTLALVLGAAASGTLAASGDGNLFNPWHIGLGLAVLGVVAYSVFHGYDMARSGCARRLRRILFAMTVVQLALGMIVAAIGGSRATTVAWLHAMAGTLLALGLASLAARAVVTSDQRPGR
jgi:hypothetical protein